MWERVCFPTKTLTYPRKLYRMHGRCAVPRTLFQCVCTPHRNRTGRLSPFTEYAPSASRFKPDCSTQSKVTHSRTRMLNIARTANRWLPVGCILAPEAYAEGNDVDVNRFKRAAPAETRRCLLIGAKPTSSGNADISVSDRLGHRALPRMRPRV